jgi:D-glycero-alpha-D-manno-heptose-7-phosphate kinase
MPDDSFQRSAPGARTGSRTVIRARAPLRLGLAGGGTDLSPYCDEHGGAVLNVTIDRYAYAIIEPSPDGRVHFAARDLGIEENFDAEAAPPSRLAIHAGVYRRMIGQFGGGVPRPLRLTTWVDAPAGSGLGSSSALVVAMVEAFRALLALPLGLYDVAHLAFEIERLDLNLAGGKQDQYAAAFGGANFIEFLASDRVIVNPLRVSRGCMNELETSLVTCFTGVSRRSEQIIEEQQRRMAVSGGEALESLHQLKRDAVEMKQALLRGEIRQMAEILGRSWEAKKRTASGVSSTVIEEMYETARAHGALAGKVSGAGGGGFVMFIVPPQRRVELIRALNRGDAMASAVHFTQEGAESWTTEESG